MKPSYLTIRKVLNTGTDEFNRYVETFSHAIGIPEEDFISYLEEKGLYKNNANQKSE